MPFEGEFAGYKPLARIANSERVQDIVSRCKKQVPDEGPSEAELLITDVKPSDWLPDLVLSIDGSYQPVPVENGYPGAELAYLTVAVGYSRCEETTRTGPEPPSCSTGGT